MSNDRSKRPGRECPLVKTESALVSVVDDDESIRESLPALIREFGHSTNVFSSGEEFLASDCIKHTRCLIVDVFLRGMSGPELLQLLESRGVHIEVIYITAHADETLRSRLIEDGAAACLFKPFSDSALISALQVALAEKRPH